MCLWSPRAIRDTENLVLCQQIFSRSRPTPGKAPQRGTLDLSLEEGFLIDLADRTCHTGGRGIYDKTLSSRAGAGILYSHAARRVSFAVLRGTARVVLASLRRRHRR